MFRLDMYLVSKGYFTSRERAKQAILAGEVFINGKIAKPALKISGNEEIKIGNILKYVSRGALKLEKAKDVFNIDFNNRIVLDIGSSTGGFTEVALLNGAKKVIAVDVGKDQLHESLRANEKVYLKEETDFRFIEREIIADADLIVSDVSFISLRNIIPKIIDVFGTKVEAMLLFKPQFECGRALATKFCGVIRDKKVHEDLLKSFIQYLESLNFVITGLNYSPIAGKSGNIEYLLHLNNGKKNYNIKKVIDKAFENM